MPYIGTVSIRELRISRQFVRLVIRSFFSHRSLQHWFFSEGDDASVTRFTVAAPLVGLRNCTPLIRSGKWMWPFAGYTNHPKNLHRVSPVKAEALLRLGGQNRNVPSDARVTANIAILFLADRSPARSCPTYPHTVRALRRRPRLSTNSSSQ